MRVVVDSNVLFSIIVSGEKSKAFRLLEEHGLTLFAPEEVILEFRRHATKLKKFAKDFEYRTFLAFSLVQVIPLEFYSDKIGEAYQIASKFDEKYTPFIALAMKLNIPLWTGDKKILRAAISTGKFLALDSAALESLLNGGELENVINEMKTRLNILGTQ
ncbi:PIN domain-containing protein [Thermococcus sp.]